LLSRLDEAVLRNIGTVACLTEADKAYYIELARQIGVSATVEVLPSYFDGSPCAAPPSEVAAPRSDRPRHIGILGTWTWESNRLGVEWFLREVLPHIDGEYEVVIAGNGLQADQLPARVRYLGFVESAEQFYRSSDVIAIPSTAGGGVQEKTIEAIGYGVPVVATDVAVRGIQPCPSHVRVVSTPREFAAACCWRQGFDPLHAQAEACAWNGVRRLQYTNAIDKLLAIATHRTCVRHGPR
jgi:glycosyltransferase involved in cell wall biosynthesis